MSHGDLTAELWTVGVIGARTMGIGLVHDRVLQGLSAVLVVVPIYHLALGKAAAECWPFGGNY